jgi:hypothetical protein
MSVCVGVARWLDRQSFALLSPTALGVSASGAQRVAEALAVFFTVARVRTGLIAVATALLATAALINLYRRILAPRVLRSHLKTE